MWLIETIDLGDVYVWTLAVHSGDVEDFGDLMLVSVRGDPTLRPVLHTEEYGVRTTCIVIDLDCVAGL